RTDLGSDANGPDRLDLPPTLQNSIVEATREIVFIDPSVPDLNTILGNLRLGVEAIVLDTTWPVSRQMAAALKNRQGFSVVHIVAHGAPGRLNFSGGEWSLQTLEEEAGDFAAIRQALSERSDLRVWSCDTGAGTKGRVFVERLACAINAPIAA